MEKFSTWLSDTSDVDDFVALQLDDQFERNRFYIGYDRIYCNEEKRYICYPTKDDRSIPDKYSGFFGYDYFGTIHENIHVYRLTENGGGTLTTKNLIFVKIFKDFGIDATEYFKKGATKNNKGEFEEILYLDTRERNIIYKIGSLHIGQESKLLKVDGNDILIGHYNNKYDNLEDTIKVTRYVTKFK